MCRKHTWYDGFGNITAETDSNLRGRYAWTGREVDTEIELQYNRARYYDAKTGRWVSQDPLGFDAGDSNLYRYVKNLPTQSTDPTGLQEAPWVPVGEKKTERAYEQKVEYWELVQFKELAKDQQGNWRYFVSFARVENTMVWYGEFQDHKQFTGKRLQDKLEAVIRMWEMAYARYQDVQDAMWMAELAGTLNEYNGINTLYQLFVGPVPDPIPGLQIQLNGLGNLLERLRQTSLRIKDMIAKQESDDPGDWITKRKLLGLANGGKGEIAGAGNRGWAEPFFLRVPEELPNDVNKVLDVVMKYHPDWIGKIHLSPEAIGAKRKLGDWME